MQCLFTYACIQKILVHSLLWNRDCGGAGGTKVMRSCWRSLHRGRRRRASQPAGEVPPFCRTSTGSSGRAKEMGSAGCRQGQWQQGLSGLSICLGNQRRVLSVEYCYRQAGKGYNTMCISLCLLQEVGALVAEDRPVRVIPVT